MGCRSKPEVDREDSEEPLTQRSGNFSVVELAYAEEVFLGEVEANLLPSLAHGCRSNHPLVNRTRWEGVKEHGPVYRPPSSPSSILPLETRRVAPTRGVCVCDPS